MTPRFPGRQSPIPAAPVPHAFVPPLLVSPPPVPHEDFREVPAFTVTGLPEGGVQHLPFVLNSPHSGRFYPPRFLAMSRLDASTIRRSEDAFVEELFGGAATLGVPLLSANFPRAYLDVNREPWEFDPRMFAETLPAFANTRSARVGGGLGVVPRLVGDGLDIYPGRIPLEEAVGRVEKVYKPYHETLTRLLVRTHAHFGFAVLVDCHSMPASIRIGDGSVRPDFIVGDRFGTSACAALTECAVRALAGMGYRVALNKPYAGGYITENYGRPSRNFHAVQIEVNRGLYMSERTTAKTGGFEPLVRDITQLMRELTALPDDLFGPLPLAAE